MAYDTLSWELAEHFLAEHDPDPETVGALAQYIQDGIESWMSAWEQARLSPDESASPIRPRRQSKLAGIAARAAQRREWERNAIDPDGRDFDNLGESHD